jgi:hypothetical protein
VRQVQGRVYYTLKGRKEGVTEEREEGRVHYALARGKRMFPRKRGRGGGGRSGTEQNTSLLKGPKHDQGESGFFDTNLTSMVR